MVEHVGSDNKSNQQLIGKSQFVNHAIAPNAEEHMDKDVPIIEIATYSDTDVFECYVRGFEVNIVMRRTRDDWVNITQIFKVAKFSKAQRTKVLEKESLNMPHEKIQGGYGRFQGTWAPLSSAISLAEKYNITDPVVTQILMFRFDPNNPPRRRSRNSILRRSSPGVKITSPSSYNKTPKKKGNSSTSKNKKSKQSLVNPSPLHNVAFQTPQQHNMNSTDYGTNANENNSIRLQHGIGHIPTITGPYSATQKPLQFYPIPTNTMNSMIPNINQDANQSFNVQTMNQPHPNMPAAEHMTLQGNFNSINVRTSTLNNGMNIDENNSLQMVNETIDSIRPLAMASKRKLPSKPQRPRQKVDPYKDNNFADSFNNNNRLMNNGASNNFSAGSNIDMFSSNDNRTPLSSRSSSSQYIENNDDFNSNDDNTIETLNATDYKAALLQVLATEKSDKQTEKLIAKLYYPPPDFDINFIIDDQGHTPLHWATALANVPLVKILVETNANLTVYNKLGINCVTKAVFYNNCYKKQIFPDVVRLLKECLITPDANRRLPIHYLVELSVNPTKDQKIISSYIDTILTSLGQENPELLKSCLDFQDNMGNTALHLAALNLNVILWNRLSSLGASVDIVNGDNETPVSILNKFNFVPPTDSQSIDSASKQSDVSENKKYSSKKIKETYMDVSQVTISETPASSRAVSTKVRSVKKNRINDSSTQKIRKNKLSRTPGLDKSPANINSILDDIASLDSLVTSSVLKKPNVHVSTTLQQSPVIYRKTITDLQNSIIVKSPKSKHIHSPIDMLQDAGLFEENIATHLLPPNMKISALLGKLRNSSNEFASSLTGTIDGLTSGIHDTELGIRETVERIQLLENQKEEVLDTLVDIEMNPLNLKTIDEVKGKVDDLNEQIDVGKTACVQYTEKSQALKLATLVQDEEASLASATNGCLDEPISKENISQSCKLLVQLTLLQLRRRSCINKITEIKVELNSTEKLNKYRYLIGMTIDDIETKLEAIENDLQANP
ncbi:similar to Saccharomyces cerevisiae YER111C SWI4 DNA binding component of the SBF complex (Swi4p-Swi6p) [Maudiozyma barnettii]|uniref:Similar to Saccharomyces cerevisiae YER111C SWI4 DNA binding component of the SBF complex (Swi4p-Swi6p) n=1 Tax=Maudiozyma barnettii TaxID=61262 RepID=A0A8H2VBD3_9SACH|nr:SBF complex DNA-binding subunit SWI4 [Kazachstania barnettii]CAB4252158.1 similar to Saccharomyces cerevisiae YER111C SWI4 DNA binding component of the SBF complex (Swi4p-Swi6p) [Kazachstania barnettii]CAD1778733.1 similar to Saccharomyces cerevisiae YER111C SWI4 DNA binding component of the SBF complex (Swi4p-Swi6p) [Kazachstania barnettii]